MTERNAKLTNRKLFKGVDIFGGREAKLKREMALTTGMAKLRQDPTLRAIMRELELADLIYEETHRSRGTYQP